MTTLSYSERIAAAIEAHDLHMATCRSRLQGSICSTCAELVVRLDRALQQAEAAR